MKYLLFSLLLIGCTETYESPPPTITILPIDSPCKIEHIVFLETGDRAVGFYGMNGHTVVTVQDPAAPKRTFKVQQLTGMHLQCFKIQEQ